MCSVFSSRQQVIKTPFTGRKPDLCIINVSIGGQSFHYFICPEMISKCGPRLAEKLPVICQSLPWPSEHPILQSHHFFASLVWDSESIARRRCLTFQTMYWRISSEWRKVRPTPSRAGIGACWWANCLLYSTQALFHQLLLVPPGPWKPLGIPRKNNRECVFRGNGIGSNLGHPSVLSLLACSGQGDWVNKSWGKEKQNYHNRDCFKAPRMLFLWVGDKREPSVTQSEAENLGMTCPQMRHKFLGIRHIP